MRNVKRRWSIVLLTRKIISWLRLTLDLHTGKSMGRYKDIKRSVWKGWTADIVLPDLPQRISI